jgi:hypothetical protein
MALSQPAVGDSYFVPARLWPGEPSAQKCGQHGKGWIGVVKRVSGSKSVSFLCSGETEAVSMQLVSFLHECKQIRPSLTKRPREVAPAPSASAPRAVAPGDEGLSAYELERKETIRQNNLALHALGLADAVAEVRAAAVKTVAKRPKVARPARPPLQPSRRSSRLEGGPAPAYKEVALIDDEPAARLDVEPLKRASRAPRLNEAQAAQLASLDDSASQKALSPAQAAALASVHEAIRGGASLGGMKFIEAVKTKGAIHRNQRSLLANTQGLRHPGWLQAEHSTAQHGERAGRGGWTSHLGDALMLCCVMAAGGGAIPQGGAQVGGQPQPDHVRCTRSSRCCCLGIVRGSRNAFARAPA